MANDNSSNQIPSLPLYTGASIPVLGLGTYSSGKYTPDQVAQALLDAASLGYRHFDCASMYANEKEIRSSIFENSSNCST